MAAVAVEKTFLYIAYVQSVSLKEHARDLTVRLRWYIDEAHDCSEVFTLNPSARVDYCVFIVRYCAFIFLECVRLVLSCSPLQRTNKNNAQTPST